MPNRSKVTILAIETSADETSAAVLLGDKKTGKFKLLSNLIYSQIKIHQKTGGIVPEVAARAHIPKIIPVVKLALRQAKTRLGEINCLAVTTGPGLVTSLMVGVDTAKALAFALNKPIISINHLEGHLLSALGGQNLQLTTYNFPALGLVVSGGHTMLVLIKRIGEYKILGQTLDDAAGECFDKVAKILGLPYPGGPVLAKLARKGDPEAFVFPRPMINSNDYNFSFAGLKTHVLYFWQTFQKTNVIAALPRRYVGVARNDKNIKADIAACAEQAIIDVLVAKTINAAKKIKAKAILLGGGVSANLKLRKILAEAVKKNIPNSTFHIPDSDLTTDNAGMIAVAGYFHFINGHYATSEKIITNPNWELGSWR